MLPPPTQRRPQEPSLGTVPTGVGCVEKVQQQQGSLHTATVSSLAPTLTGAWNGCKSLWTANHHLLQLKKLSAAQSNSQLLRVATNPEVTGKDGLARITSTSGISKDDIQHHSTGVKCPGWGSASDGTFGLVWGEINLEIHFVQNVLLLHFNFTTSWLLNIWGKGAKVIF